LYGRIILTIEHVVVKIRKNNYNILGLVKQRIKLKVFIFFQNEEDAK